MNILVDVLPDLHRCLYRSVGDLSTCRTGTHALRGTGLVHFLFRVDGHFHSGSRRCAEGERDSGLMGDQAGHRSVGK